LSAEATSSTAAAAAATATVEANNKKRRKKPRLVECEHKLSELQAENAMLKRHLANLSAQSHQLDQERHAQESRMRQMVDEGSSEEALDEAVRTFQDMYSDYGRRRHKELVFHLDQLLRLANPTNFTKMGLWTMQSKNSKNPIASILQKELEINTQQGKKILDQREKIRTVCSNMKEVIDPAVESRSLPRLIVFTFILPFTLVVLLVAFCLYGIDAPPPRSTQNSL
jgi:predicted RNase H-like nuclease (RuvC/YqgF family)